MTHTFSWHEVYQRLQAAPPGKLWGIPRGGQIVAGLTGRAVDTAEEADCIVDDIVDSGATQATYQVQYPKKPFWALHVKTPGDPWVVFPWEQTSTLADIASTVTRQLEFLGEDPCREGLRDTPRRVIAALQELTVGYKEDVSKHLRVTFAEPCDQLIVVRDIPFFSLCEHHLLPFYGTVSVGYIPQDNRVVGLSKIPRLVRAITRRLQTQERVVHQIAHAIEDALSPLGVGVVARGFHTCMAMRGIESQGHMLTSCLLGALRTTARGEFFALCHGKSTQLS